MSKDLTDLQLLHELEPVVEEKLNRHLKMGKEWNPHEYVPWSEGRDFDALGGEDWEPEQSQAVRGRPGARWSEPAHRGQPAELPPRDRDALRPRRRVGHLGHRWTAEEGRHGIAIRDYLLVTRAVDPVELERARMEHTMVAGYEPAGDLYAESLFDSVAYVSFQELATRVSHRNTGKVTDDPIADQLLRRIAADENLHMIFYRNSARRGAGASRPTRRCARSPTWCATSRCPATRIAGLPAQGRR